MEFYPNPGRGKSKNQAIIAGGFTAQMVIFEEILPRLGKNIGGE
ncbi:MAG: hypothetical protein AAB347_08880 [Bacteroidota bacterium]